MSDTGTTIAINQRMASPTFSVVTSGTATGPTLWSDTGSDAIGHEHVLPLGWSYKFDSRTNKYHLMQDNITNELIRKPNMTVGGWDTPIRASTRTTPTRTSPALSITGKYSYSSLRTPRDGISIANRICQQFPNVDELHINQLLRTYHNRENLVISALLSEGHQRSAFIIDESLFYKLKAAFPNVESETIRRLLIKNENKEHNTVAAILGLFGLFNTARYEYSQCPQLKLKYLKFAYADVDELILLDLLFNNDNDVSRVIKHLESLNYAPSELKLKISKISEVAVIKEATDKLNALRPTSLALAAANKSAARYHPNLEEQELLRRQLVELFPTTDVALINNAMDVTGYDRDMAIHLLKTMTPQNSEAYRIRTLLDKEKPTVRVLVSRETQTKSTFEDLFGQKMIIPVVQEPKKSSNEVEDTEDTEENGESPSVIKEKSPEKDVKMVQEVSTWTKEDGIIIKASKKGTLAKGPQPAIAKGACKENLSLTRQPRIKCDLNDTGRNANAKGANADLRKGPQQKMISHISLRQGPLAENRIDPANKSRIVRIKNAKQLFDENDDDY